jgi:hypothetical protein
MTSYLAYTRKVAEKTPPTRNRVIDFWRAVAIGVVVYGHWLAASIWLKPDESVELLNSLEWVPYAAWVTWIVQVMPIFFLVGGYANARALRRVESGDERRRDWITTRIRRLFTPVIPLLLVWTVLIVVMRPFVPAEIVHAGAMAATVPLWFMAVYIVLTASAPWTHRAWKQYGWWSVIALAGTAVAVDLIRFRFDVDWIGWTNFLFVWAAIHQVGFWWASRDASGRSIPVRRAWALSAAALAVLILVTWIGWYPVAMVGVPGTGLTNMTPPTAALILLGLIQAGVIWGTLPRVTLLTERVGVWHVVVAVSGVIMTVYLWHLTAMVLVAAAGLFTFGGVAFEIEPGTTVWWVTRPLWLATLTLVTAGLVAVFARFEWRINPAPAPRSRKYVLGGVLLTAGSAAAVAYFGLASDSATINWFIPISAVVGAALIGAFPVRKH